AVLLAAAGRQRTAEHDLLLAVVIRRVELKLRVPRDVVDRPAGERTRHRHHIVLRVAAVDAERVQLEEFAAVVLVQTGSGQRRAVGPDVWWTDVVARRLRLPVVEIQEHGWMSRGG